MIKAAWPVPQPNVLVLDTREAILDLAPLLEAVAERCGRRGAMSSLAALLEDASGKQQIPHLVLVLRPEEHQGHSLTAKDVEGAAFLLEPRLFGVRCRAVATAHAPGFSGVIAPRGNEGRTAALALRAMVERGADVVLATYEDDPNLDVRSAFSGWTSFASAVTRRRSTHADAGSEWIADMVVRRRSVRGAAAYWATRLFAGFVKPFGSLGVLAAVLRQPELHWTARLPAPRRSRPVLGKDARPAPGSVIKDALLN